MTGPDHYEHAENWLFKAQHQDARGGSETPESCAAIAQVHATLAQVYAYNRLQAETYAMYRSMLDELKEHRENVPTTIVHVDGELDPDAVARALNEARRKGARI